MNRIVQPYHRRHTARHVWSAFFLLLLLPALAHATELVNDGWSDGQAAVFQEGFVTGEIGAARIEVLKWDGTAYRSQGEGGTAWRWN